MPNPPPVVQVRELDEEIAALQHESDAIYEEAGDAGALDFSLVKRVEGGIPAVAKRLRELDKDLGEKRKLRAEYADLAEAFSRQKQDEDEIEARARRQREGTGMPANAGPAGREDDYEQLFKRNLHGDALIRAAITGTDQDRELARRGSLRQFIDADSFDTGRNVKVQVGPELRALFQTGAGYSLKNPASGIGAYARDPMREPFPIFPQRVLEYFRSMAHPWPSYEYMELTRWGSVSGTSDAVEVAEASSAAAGGDAADGRIPEGQFEYTPRFVNTTDVGVTVPYTARQARYWPQSINDLESDMLEMMSVTLDIRALRGSGAGDPPQLRGMENVAGINTRAKGGDPIPTAFGRLCATISQEAGGARPSVAFMHPNDWWIVRMLQDRTGNYVFGHPNQGIGLQFYGIPVIDTIACSEHQIDTGDFASKAMWIYDLDMFVRMVDQHGTEATKQISRLIAVCSGAFVFRQPKAFGTITAISS